MDTGLGMVAASLSTEILTTPPGNIGYQRVNVILRDGYRSAGQPLSEANQPATLWGWWHDNDGNDIVAYKLVPDDPVLDKLAPGVLAEVQIEVGKDYTMVVGDENISLYSTHNGGFVRHLDQNETAMVRAAFKSGKESK